jgi:uncharacterized protein Yka (UPF0111/DUF47 family)
MTAKAAIVERLGEPTLVLPQRIAAGLAANDRAKVRMTALQAAQGHALRPDVRVPALQRDCIETGLDPGAIAALVAGSRMQADGRIAMPGAGELHQGLVDDIATMLEALRTADPAAAEAPAARLEALARDTAVDRDDVVGPGFVSAVTAVRGDGTDSPHRLVMELHRELNRLAAATAGESIDGARVFGILDEDRAPIAAFMQGLAATRGLKFDHPGLDTTATRCGGRLLIQNDIGTTDAHVLVVSVDADAVAVVYTDVHRARAKFFARRLAGCGAQWSGLAHEDAEGLGEEAEFWRLAGRLKSREAREREAFLHAIGANLVFLIDWNKARKQLRLFVDKAEALRLLDWAAEQRLGHRGFLQSGGGDMVNRAVRRIAADRIGYGTRLDAALGRDAAVSFLRATLRHATEGLLAGRADRLVHDAVATELSSRLSSAETAVLEGAVRQAGLARDLAAALGQAVREAPLDGAAFAARARAIEEKADRIALALREGVRRSGVRAGARLLVDVLEDAIDQLEEAAFYFGLLEAGAPAAPSVDALCEAAVAAAEAVARAADAASLVPQGRRIDADDALEAASALAEIEHRADLAERAVLAVALGPGGPRIALAELARRVERATDCFAHAGHLLRAFVLDDPAQPEQAA